MSSAMMMERTGLGMPGVGVPGFGTPTMGAPTTTPAGVNWMMVPRCTLRFEKCQGGMKCHVQCEDKMACSFVQNLCTSLAGGVCSFYCQWNGMNVCCCNLTMGLCKVECTNDGVCFTCTSGDSHCCEMIQACCDSCCCMMESGCNCCVVLNSVPVCYGCCETKTSKKGR